MTHFPGSLCNCCHQTGLGLRSSASGQPVVCGSFTSSDEISQPESSDVKSIFIKGGAGSSETKGGLRVEEPTAESLGGALLCSIETL